MGCQACKCDSSLSDTGHGCTPIQEVAAILVAVPVYDSTGAKNKIPFTETLNAAYFAALINQTDKSKRWRPFPKMKNVLDKRDDATFFTFDDQTVEFIREGARKFTSMISNESGKGATAPQMKKIIESVRCENTAFFIISRGNQLIGKISEDGLSLEPIEIDEQSILAGFMKKTNSDPQYIALQFNWSALEKDDDLRMFDCSEIGDANLLGLTGLKSACIEVTEITTTGMTFKVKTLFGTPASPILVPGLVETDFKSAGTDTPSKLWNVTDEADVDISSFSEDEDGVYSITFPAQDPGDALQLDAVKTGYDFTCMSEELIDVES